MSKNKSTMKYVIVIPDGAADYPIAELGNKTAFEAAKMPALARLAKAGRLGTASTTPVGFPCGSDVCSMSLLGYDPAKYHKGRAPLEAAALGIPLDIADWIFRVNFITVVDGKMRDHSGGHISSEEAGEILVDLKKELPIPGMELHPGVSYRNIMVDVGNRGGKAGRDWSDLKTTPPHDVPGEPMLSVVPKGKNAEVLVDFILKSEKFLKEHRVNKARVAAGKMPTTHVWPWGQGKKPSVPTFESRFGLKGAMITAVDLLAGIAGFIEWDRLNVPGQTSYHDNDYAAAGAWGIDALEKYDVVCVHVEAPDEASHGADAKTKVLALEAIDEKIIGPIHEALEKRGGAWRMLVMPDHYTRVSTRKHDATPVPFLLAGEGMAPENGKGLAMTEANANGAGWTFAHGHELMEAFLGK